MVKEIFHKPNYDILKENFNLEVYNKLRTKFEENPRQISLNDMFNLYYQWVFTEEYSQFAHCDVDIRENIQDESLEILNDYIKKGYNEIKDYPYDPVMWETMGEALEMYGMVGKRDTEIRVNLIRDVILDSGDGTEENPYYVTNIEDEYFIVNHLFPFADVKLQELRNNQYDVLHVDSFSFETGEETEKTVWFHFGPHMRRLSNYNKKESYLEITDKDTDDIEIYEQ